MKYKEEDLQQLHEVQKGMLAEFIRVCNKYNIRYFVSFGTAIGTVRHQGFIPWDDDIDIGMVREDYEKLRQVPVSEWQNDVFLCDPKDDVEFHLWNYPRLYKKNTVFETNFHHKYTRTGKDGSQPLHIWMDIFMFDRFTSVESEQKKRKKALVLRDAYYYSKARIICKKNASVKQRLSCALKNTFHYVSKLIPNCPEKICRYYERHIPEQNGEYIVAIGLRSNERRYVFKYEDYFPTVQGQFESMTVELPRNYDKILNAIYYGSYMTVPPVEKQINHAPLFLDFGDGVIHESICDDE